MRIDGNRRLAECGVQDHVRGLATHAGQCFELGASVRNLAAVLVEQDPAGLDDVLCLGVEQADGLDVLAEFPLAQFDDGLRRVGDRIQLFGGLVDADVRCLCRQDDGDQQFKSICIVKFGVGFRIVFGQPLKYPGADLFIHESIAVAGSVVTRFTRCSIRL